MNSLKCAFEVTSRKFPSFIVRHRGIEIDQSKIEAIQNMLEPKDVHELKSLQGRLAYIWRFISNLANCCQPFNQSMEKDATFVWDDACKNALKKIKQYLLKTLVLAALILEKILIIYIIAQKQSLGALLAQILKGKNMLYYLSWTLVGVKLNYSPIKNKCLAVIFATKKLWHYMLAHLTWWSPLSTSW